MSIDLTDDLIRIDIESRLTDAQRRLATLMGDVGFGDHAMASRARFLAWRLAGHEGSLSGQNAAAYLLELLVPALEQRERAFWATPLGKAMAWWTGGQGALARRKMIAETVMGVSRQAVYAMIESGRLLNGPGGDVTAESLAALLQHRYPQDAPIEEVAT